MRLDNVLNDSIIKPLTDDKPLHRKRSSSSLITIKGGIEEADDEVITMLSDGIDDELTMRLASLNTVNQILLLNSVEIAKETFHKMDIANNAKVEQWELIESFNLAIKTAKEIIILKTETKQVHNYHSQNMEKVGKIDDITSLDYLSKNQHDDDDELFLPPLVTPNFKVDQIEERLSEKKQKYQVINKKIKRTTSIIVNIKKFRISLV